MQPDQSYSKAIKKFKPEIVISFCTAESHVASNSNKITRKAAIQTNILGTYNIT